MFVSSIVLAFGFVRVAGKPQVCLEIEIAEREPQHLRRSREFARGFQARGRFDQRHDQALRPDGRSEPLHVGRTFGLRQHRAGNQALGSELADLGQVTVVP